ncbi:class I SAM-dependent methyltransferase [Desulfonatronovibrio hydrogenovorans]|uniref:class I SAM-dependent methyltransferase n=1 Tax=Desulfonatronovibrio hydrogenovorans TaxID=53245 RepID=UPI000A06F96C|nr:class I SAM-dependent methyltransferase [Desulfonatronovibrio hydrogenovorans]
MSSRFHHAHAQDYFNQTIEVDPSSFLLPRVKHFMPGSTVLDVGCGSGRDMLWLTERGPHCTGLDRSTEMAALAREHTGLPLIEAIFESYDFSRMNMDGLLLIGVLVRFYQTHALITMKQNSGRA